MPNFFYNYVATPDFENPLYRVKMAGFAGYLVGIAGASSYYMVALLSGYRVPQTSVVCLRWILTGTAAGVAHATGSYMSSNLSGKTNHWGNHLVGGAAAGVILGWRGSVGLRLGQAATFGLLSVFAKTCVDFQDSHPNFYVPKYGETYFSPYLTLNHRWMNPQMEKHDQELEEKV